MAKKRNSLNSVEGLFSPPGTKSDLIPEQDSAPSKDINGTTVQNETSDINSAPQIRAARSLKSKPEKGTISELKQQVNVRLTPEQHTQLKVSAALTNTTLSDIISTAVSEYFERHKN